MWRPWLFRLALGAGLVSVYMAGVLIASQRAATAMAAAANRFLESLTPEQRQQAAFPFDVGRAPALALHPDRDVPAQGADDQGDDRAAAQARARPAQGRAEPARLPRPRRRSWISRPCSARSRPPSAPPRPAAAQRAARARPGALLLLGVRHAVGEGHVGLARRRASRLAAFHGREAARWSRARRRSSARTRRKCARDRRRDCAFLGAEEDAARALLDSLDASAADEGDHRRHRAQRHRHDERTSTSRRCRRPA